MAARQDTIMDKIIKEYNTINDNFYFHHTRSTPSGRQDYYGPESHDRFELFYLIEGEVEYIVQGQHYLVHPGDMIFISPSRIHSLVINGKKNYERIVLVFDYRVLDEYFSRYPMDLKHLLSGRGHVIQKDIVDQSDIKSVFFSIAENQEEDKYRQLYLVSCTIQLIIALDKLFADKSLDFLKPASTDVFIETVTGYIQEHITDPMNLDQIAQDLYLSKSTLCHKFKQKMNMTINEYITIKKIYYASDLIHSGVSATDACQAIGYNYYTTFYYNYKKIIGKAPNETKNRS